MAYLQTPAGVEQSKIDEMVKYRQQLRTRNLVINSDSRSPYNILSGENREPPPMPPAVATSKPYSSHIAQATPWTEWEKRGQRSRGPF